MKNIPQSGDYTASFNKFIYNEIPAESKCLDVGCWTGNLGKMLIAKKGCTVDGIDVNKSVLKSAKRNGYRSTYDINLNNDNYALEGIENNYDVIICADIIEHLINPERVLNELKKKLSKNGIIIISLPNVAFLLNRLQLLFGKWNYREFGTLDKTHLKFFTVDSLIKLVTTADFRIVKVKPYNQFGLLRYIEPLNKLLPKLFSYQILLVARK